MKTDAAQNAEAAGMAFINLLLTPLLAAYRGWVLSILWRWFVVPLGVEPVGVWQAAGISILVALLTTKLEWNENAPKPSIERTARRVALVILAGLISLVFGALYRGFGA